MNEIKLMFIGFLYKTKKFGTKVVASKLGPILIFITISLILALFVVDDYGLSWDEYQDITYGELSLNAYKGDEDFQWLGKDRKYYGPVYWMAVSLITKFVTSMNNDVFFVDVWKYCHFAVFQISVFSFYLLCLRFMKRNTAFITALLFSIQPLLLGHAFINAKDIPFMSFFLTSIVVGLIGVDTFNRSLKDRFVRPFHEAKLPEVLRETISRNWNALSKTRKVVLVISILIVVVLFFELFVLQRVFLPLAYTIVHQAYTGTGAKSITWLFNLVAQDAYKTPVELYFPKINNLYLVVKVLYIFAVLLITTRIWRRVFQKEREKISIALWTRRYGFMIVSGILLGLTISIRTGALYAGVLVSGYYLIKSKQRAFAPLIIYWGIALFIMIVTWPYLWDSPLERFLESVRAAASFSDHPVLFHGDVIASQDLPWYYLPSLIVVQFTEPVLILSLIGTVLGIRRLRKGNIDRAGFILLLLWAGLPTFVIIVMRIPIYDNFRQLLFTIPPIFVLAGFGLSLFLG